MPGGGPVQQHDQVHAAGQQLAQIGRIVQALLELQAIAPNSGVTRMFMGRVRTPTAVGPELFSTERFRAGIDLLERFVLGGVEDGKVTLIANFDDAVADRVSASDVVKAAAAVVGGGGGGRRTMARAICLA